MKTTLAGPACVLLASALLLGGCAGRRGGAVVPPSTAIDTPRSVSPGSVHPPPMPQTRILSPSVMTSLRTPRSAIQAPGWSQLPGGAIFVTAAPDGSIWVLSSVGSGPDRSIWHYANGAWTNIPGLAMRLAVAPDNTLYAATSNGFLYMYTGSVWYRIAGDASDISVGPDGTLYVISYQPGGPYGNAIWKMVGDTWSQIPGAALRIAASWDTGTFPGGISPGGFYVVNALNTAYYHTLAAGDIRLPGGVVQVAPTTDGGLFGLGYQKYGDGSSPIFYYNLNTGVWTGEPGAAVSIAATRTAVYAIGAAGGIYTSPIVTADWPSKSPMPTPRYDLAADVVNGVLYAAGGQGAGHAVEGALEAYDPSSNTWSTKATMPTPRYGLAMADSDGLLYAAGGWNNVNSTSVVLTTFESYDTSTNTWQTGPPMGTPRGHFGLAIGSGPPHAVTPRGPLTRSLVVFAIGGENNSGVLNTVEGFDTDAGTWAAKAAMPTARSGLAVAAVKTMLYAIGGVNPSNPNGLGTVEAYDPATNSWTTKAPMPTPRSHFAVAVVNNIVYAIGGLQGGPAGLKTVEAYNPATNTWITKSSMPSARVWSAAGAVNNVIYAVGGAADDGSILNAVNAYTP